VIVEITPLAATINAIDASAGHMSVTAAAAGSLIVGGAGDTLTGGSGADTFVFHTGFGLETVAGFTASGHQHDALQFDSRLFSDWAHLLGATKQQGSDLLITYDANDKVLLKNVSLASFTISDAHFV
jgi:Ca2+-binding RTX toxin-like protein